MDEKNLLKRILTLINELIVLEKQLQPPYVYVLLCEHNTVYVGYSRFLLQRIFQHTSGRGVPFTKKYRPRQLLEIGRAKKGMIRDVEKLYIRKYRKSTVVGW